MTTYYKMQYNIYDTIMDCQAKELLIALHTISQIPQGGKLNTVGKELSIYHGTWTEYFRTFRFWNDGEPEAREYLKKFYNKVNQKCRNIVLLPKSLDTENAITGFIDAIRESIYGLEHLRNSYKNHVTMISNTKFILENIINPLLELLYDYKGLKYNKLTFKDGLLTEDIHSTPILQPVEAPILDQQTQEYNLDQTQYQTQEYNLDQTQYQTQYQTQESVEQNTTKNYKGSKNHKDYKK